MIRLFIILACSLLFIFLVAAVIGFVGERMGQFSIWKTQTWLTVRIPVIVITVIVGLTLLVVIASRISKKHEKAEKQFAQSQGWTYTESYRDPQGRTRELAGKLYKICPEKEIKLNNSMAVESGKRNIFLFSCWHRVRDWGPKEHLGFACLIESDRFGWVDSQLDISGRGSLDSLLLSYQVDMGDTEFARSFIVTSKNATTAKRVLDESVQAILLESRRGSLDYDEINIGPGGAVILTGDNRPFEEYLALVELARRIESAFE
jgi:hypothetical protein